jgi:hypothetical protein
MGELLSMSLAQYIRALEQGFTPEGHIVRISGNSPLKP